MFSSVLTGLVGRLCASEHGMCGFDSQHGHISKVKKAPRFLISQSSTVQRGEGPGDPCYEVGEIQ